jgi:polyphosphate kinase 2
MKARTEPAEPIGKRAYEQKLMRLQIELVKLHRHVIKHGEKILVIFEGRDAAGKDGTIKRIVEHLSPRETRVVALGKPSEREAGEWYFQRFVPHLPAAQEFVLFNRSWYNRAGVERVMGFCSEAQVKEFFDTVLPFEQMLLRSGIRLFKYYLDITRDEQLRRLRERRKDPLKQWKISPIDEAAVAHWDDYTQARNAMLQRSHSRHAPWIVVRADDKHQARLNVIRDILERVDCPDLDRRRSRTDRRVIREYEKEWVTRKWLAT